MLQARIALVGAVLLVLSACRIQITAPEHGSVVTESGSLDCGPSDTCNVEVVDIFFNETFIAQPEAGYEFDQWRRDPLHFCGGSNAPCNLFTSFYEENELLMALLESDDVWFLEPRFKKPNSWARKADLPVGAVGASSCVVGDRLYVLGIGTGFGAPQFVTVEYDPATDSWTQKADVPMATNWGAGAAANGKCYLIGGGSYEDSDLPTARVWEYDPAADSWRGVAPMPDDRSGNAAVTVAGKIYVVGGGSQWSFSSRGSPSVSIYDPVTDRWTSGADMPTPRSGVAAGAIDGYIYVVGGANNNMDNSNLVHRYDPVNDTWTSRANYPVPVSWARASTYNGSLYVYGGFDPEAKGLSVDGTTNWVYRYEPQADRWTRVADMMQARYAVGNGHSTINGRIYAVGGRERRESAPLAIVEEYTP